MVPLKMTAGNGVKGPWTLSEIRSKSNAIGRIRQKK